MEQRIELFGVARLIAGRKELTVSLSRARRSPTRYERSRASARAFSTRC